MENIPKLFVLIRYSFLDAKGMSWALGKSSSSPDEYKSRLFNDARMRGREHLFSKVTLPSFARQRGVAEGDFKVILIVSDLLPTDARLRLEEIVAPYSFVEICSGPPEADMYDKALRPFLEAMPEGTLYATARLDDDDGVSRNYVQQIARYTRPAFSGFVVSFGRGVLAEIGPDGCVDAYRDFYHTKMSVGMAMIQTRLDDLTRIRSIFNLGNHRKVDQRVPTIIYAKDPMFFHSKHVNADTYKEGERERLDKMPRVDTSFVRQYFSLDKGLDRTRS